MSPARSTAHKLLAVGLAFAVTLGVLTLLQRGGDEPPTGPREGRVLSPEASTDELIRVQQAVVRRDPDDPRAYAALAGSYLQKVRESGDPAYYARAAGVLRRGRRVAPGDYRLLAAAGTLALARHDFRGGLRLGRAAQRANRASNAAFPVLVDAQVELGDYDGAARTLQRFLDRKPTLASYARASYFRELHGDLAGALEAMRLAVSAGGPAPENVAYVQTLLGNLELDRGRPGPARRAYRTALRGFPGYVAAEAGLARVDATHGRLRRAISRYREVVARLPLPEHVIALGEAELAAGERAAGRRDLALVRAQQRLLAGAGVNTDVEVAIFEADHGSRRRAVTLARRAWAAAPSVRSADALGWALTRAGSPDAGRGYARRALRLGSRDPLFLYHAGVAAAKSGQAGEARAFLSRALARNPRFSPLHAPRARRMLESLA